MRRIESRINTRSESFQANRAHNLRVRAEFLGMMQDVRHHRPERDIKRLRDQGKLLVRERLDLLLDPGTPFLELSPLAANHAKYDAHIKGTGVVSGIGVVNGREVMVLANDSTIKGGAVYLLGAKKSIRALKIALDGPPLVKAATGEYISAAELGGADVHTRISGTADYAVDSETASRWHAKSEEL